MNTLKCAADRAKKPRCCVCSRTARSNGSGISGGGP